MVESLYNDKKEGNEPKTVQEKQEFVQEVSPKAINESIETVTKNVEIEPQIAEKKEEIPSIQELNVKFEEMYEKTFGKKLPEKLQEAEGQYNTEKENNVLNEANIQAETMLPQENTQESIQENQQTIPVTETMEPIKENQTEEPVQNMSIFESEETYVEPVKYKFIGIAFSTYIILEIDKEMYILDQHDAHERIMYEKIKQNFYNNEAKDSQLMLLPDVITLSHKEMEITKANMKMFEQAGFTLEEFGDNTIKLTGVPNICIDLDTKELFLNILDEIDTLAVTARQEIEEKFIATVACKAAVKANMALSYQEVEALMADLLQLPNPFTCPHGRPTAIRMSKIDIEKKFSRR